MFPPYLYHQPLSSSSVTALIVLPEIFGMNASIRETVDRFQQTLNVPCFGLDFFYSLTQEPNDFDYKTDLEKGITLMNNMTGDLFLSLFQEAKEEIQKSYPDVTHFAVAGFCFGGKLALLSGIDHHVNRIISFYGGNTTLPFYKEQNVIEALCHERSHDDKLQVVALFGEDDTSIPESDRDTLYTHLDDAHIHYTELLYEAGHAFFNSHRSTYNQEAANKAWNDLLVWINGQ